MTKSIQKRRIFLSLTIILLYAVIYLIDRILHDDLAGKTLGEFLLGSSPRQNSYLVGWLLKNRLFWSWIIMDLIWIWVWDMYPLVISTAAGFTLGIILGELFGPAPNSPYGPGIHYGWAIWIGVMFLSVVVGGIIQRCKKTDL